MTVHFVDIDQLLMIIIQNQPARLRQVFLNRLCKTSVNIIPQDQIDDEHIRFNTPIPPLRNQAILAAPAISISTTHYGSQYF